MRRRSSIWSSASDGCRVRKKVVDFKQLTRESTVDYCSRTAYGSWLVAMGHTDDGYEAWTHRDAAHAYGKRRGHTPR